MSEGFDAVSEPVARHVTSGLSKIGTVLGRRAWKGAGPAGVTPTQAQALELLRGRSASLGGLAAQLGVVHVEPGPGVADRVRAAAPDGVDAIYDLVGGAALEEVASVLADRSKLITAADRETVARLGGSPVRRARDRATLEEVARLVVDGVLRPFVTRTFPSIRRRRRCASWRRGTPAARS
ncbi:zinc-binding dehydrogenase [Nonomuraea rhizosphaerae]|uniref:zinc-binding dehydrogenase n=1 Tax=Nonomuraea rhizosphaerae TaxID=2665663 RepID=UPI001C5DAD62|nr:zinc-binding dehydrogenase [Nonomuraea rhizosphaerae]